MTTPHQTTNRLRLTQAQREELERQASYLGISLQQAYMRLRSGAISLGGE
jgi:hypothetical protein